MGEMGVKQPLMASFGVRAPQIAKKAMKALTIGDSLIHVAYSATRHEKLAVPLIKAVVARELNGEVIGLRRLLSR